MISIVRTILVALIVFTNFTYVDAQTRSPEMDEPVARIEFRDGDESLIRYADLLIHLALQPDVKIDPPNATDLRGALQVLIDQKLIERSAIKEAEEFEWASIDKGIEPEVRELLMRFRSSDEIESRLKIVGFRSIMDPPLGSTFMRWRYVKRYIDIHFRCPIKPDRDTEERYYNEIYAPEFRKSNPGILLPKLEEKRSVISSIIVEKRLEAELKNHLDRRRKATRIEMLIEL